MKDLVQARHCLGMRIEITYDGISLDQEAYISRVIWSDMSNCKRYHGPGKNQPTVALSTCEAEYMSLTVGSCTRSILVECGMSKQFGGSKSIEIRCDNQITKTIFYFIDIAVLFLLMLHLSSDLRTVKHFWGYVSWCNKEWRRLNGSVASIVVFEGLKLHRGGTAVESWRRLGWWLRQMEVEFRIFVQYR